METQVFLSAGDPSGDNAAGRLIAALQALVPDLSVFGLGGEKLKFLGQRQLAKGKDLAVLGFWEVAKRFPFFRRLMSRCVSEINRHRPRAVILVDYPGFNLRLARRIRHLG
ncbi:MAG: lipid-A-disaccharide synthase, partial [Candidatus Zixiibacteriota bacterium]